MLRRALYLLLVVSLLAGCTKVKNTKVDNSYTDEVTETTVVIRDPGKMSHTIQIKLGAEVTPQRKFEIRKQIFDAINQMKASAPELISAELNKKGVHVVQSESSKTSLILVPFKVRTNLRYNFHHIWYRAVLRDNQIQKDVWSAEVRLLVVYRQPKDGEPGRYEGIVDDVARNVVANMANSGISMPKQ